MPFYPHKCRPCDHAFTAFRPMADAGEAAECPRCGRPSPFDFGGLAGVGLIDYVGVPPTVGQQAERNARRLGGELVAVRREEHAAADPLAAVKAVRRRLTKKKKR